MAYGVSSVVQGSTVGYPSDSLAAYFYFFAVFDVPFSVDWCDKQRLPFPIGGPLELNLYLYQFLDLLGTKHIATY